MSHRQEPASAAMSEPLANLPRSHDGLPGPTTLPPAASPDPAAKHSASGDTPSLSSRLSSLLPECHILAGTWNVGNALGGFKEINRWLGRMAASIKAATPSPCSSLCAGPRVPDMIVFGLQEWSGMFRAAHPRLEDWCEEIQIALEQHFPLAQYDILRYHQWVGLVLFIAVRTPKPTVVSSPQLYLTAMTQSSVGLGPLWMGNKGALGLMLHCTFGPVGLPLTVAPSKAEADSHRRIKICFVNSHLAAQKYKLGLRRTNYHRICEALRFPSPLVSDFCRRSHGAGEMDLETGHADSSRPRGLSVRPAFRLAAGTSALLYNPAGSENMFDADVVFWLGDLNYRLYDPSFFRKGSQVSDLLPGESLGVPNVVRVSPRPNLNFKMAQSPAGHDENDGDSRVVSVAPSHNLPLTCSALQLPPGAGHSGLDEAIGSFSHQDSPLSTTPRSFYPTLTECLYSRQWDRLLSYDQLYFEMRTKLAFSVFTEPNVSFPPTYKYAKGTDYLSIEDWKRHWPAWCDRILYYTRPALWPGRSWTVQPILYDSCPVIMASDHKPVHAYFRVMLQPLSRPVAEEEQRPAVARLFAPFSPASCLPNRAGADGAAHTVSEVDRKYPGSCLDAACHWAGYHLSNVLMIPRIWLILFVVLFVIFITLIACWAKIYASWK